MEKCGSYRRNKQAGLSVQKRFWRLGFCWWLCSAVSVYAGIYSGTGNIENIYTKTQTDSIAALKLGVHGKADSSAISDTTKKFGNIAGHGKADSSIVADNSKNSDSLNHKSQSYYDTVGNGARDSLLSLRLPLHGKADSSVLADSTKKNGVHGVTQYRLPYSNGTNQWGSTELRYDPSYTTFGIGAAATSNIRFYTQFGPTNMTSAMSQYIVNKPAVNITGNYGTASALNMYCYSNLSGGANDSGTYRGFFINSYHASAGTVGNVDAAKISYGTYGAGLNMNVTGNVIGFDIAPIFQGTGTIGAHYAIRIQDTADAGGATITNPYCIISALNFPSRFEGSLQIDNDANGLVLGEDQDATISHDGTNTVIRTTTGKTTISDGTLELVDSAQVWNDVADMTLSGIKGVGSAGEPTWAATGVGISLNRFAIGDSAQAHGEISHWFTMGDSGDVHVHYHVNGEDSTPRHIGVTLRTQIYNAMGDSVTWYNSTDVYDTIPANTNHFSHRVIHTGKLSMPNIAKGAIVYQSVIRIAHGTAPTSNPFFSKGGMHRKVNSLGSTTIY